MGTVQQKTQNKTVKKLTTKMKCALIFGLAVNAKYINNGCQCSDLTIIDRYGKVKGACQSTYNGHAWCFLPEHGYSSCSDSRDSSLVRGREWSYEACNSYIKSVPHHDDHGHNNGHRSNGHRNNRHRSSGRHSNGHRSNGRNGYY